MHYEIYFIQGGLEQIVRRKHQLDGDPIAISASTAVYIYNIENRYVEFQ